LNFLHKSKLRGLEKNADTKTQRNFKLFSSASGEKSKLSCCFKECEKETQKVESSKSFLRWNDNFKKLKTQQSKNSYNVQGLGAPHENGRGGCSA
jgi:hypothetical protein